MGLMLSVDGPYSIVFDVEIHAKHFVVYCHGT
jgi:hypothetical protein